MSTAKFKQEKSQHILEQILPLKATTHIGFLTADRALAG